MNWNLEGKKVTGMYMGEFPVTGKVEFSRVKYGGSVEHYIALDNTIEVYGATRDRVILEQKNIENVEEI